VPNWNQPLGVQAAGPRSHVRWQFGAAPIPGRLGPEPSSLPVHCSGWDLQDHGGVEFQKHARHEKPHLPNELPSRWPVSHAQVHLRNGPHHYPLQYVCPLSLRQGHALQESLWNQYLWGKQEQGEQKTMGEAPVRPTLWWSLGQLAGQIRGHELYERPLGHRQMQGIWFLLHGLRLLG